MKKSHKIYDEYSTDLEINNSSPLYKSWHDKWLSYLRNLNGLYENQPLTEIKFNIVEHYTEDGLEKGDFDPSSNKIIGNYQNYKVIDLFDEDHKQVFLEFMNLNLSVSSVESFINKYGTLGSPVVQRKYSEQGEDEHKNNNIIQGELIQCWYVEIKNLQSLLKNYQYYLKKDFKKLNEKFKIIQKNETYYWSFKETENFNEQFPLVINFFSKNYNYPVTINNENSSEVWDRFRVARRAYPYDLTIAELENSINVSCSHNGYKRLIGKPTHSREWQLFRSSLIIKDKIKGPFKNAYAYFHFHPYIKIIQNDTGDWNLIIPNGQQVKLQVKKVNQKLRKVFILQSLIKDLKFSA